MKKVKFALILMLLASFLHLFAQTKEGMSLGNLQFVKPTNDITMSSRSLKMKMSTASISPLFYAKVGGVAFIQTAIPNFEVESLQLNCDYLDNNSYAVINGQRYDIPLEVWQLQPIVEYADDENNAAITIYGDQDAPVKFHEAFIDKLIGLRLLQVDLLLAGSIDKTDKGKFPSYDGNEYIMNEKEKKEYHKYVLLDSLSYNKSYQDISMAALDSINMQIYSLSEGYDTYIYTDYNQDISFNVNSSDKSIEFSGKPYYRFANFAYRDTPVIDSLEMYNSIENYTDSKEQNYLFRTLQSLIISLCKNLIPGIVEAVKTTDYFRNEGSQYIHLINPLIYDEATAICQWSAFFRYVKQNHSETWRQFKEDVRSLTYDAPDVWTPVKFGYSSDNYSYE